MAIDRASKIWAYSLGVDCAEEVPQRWGRGHRLTDLSPFRPETEHYVYWLRGFRHLTLEPGDPKPSQIPGMRARKGNKRQNPDQLSA